MNVLCTAITYSVCPVEEKCQEESLIYQAEVKSEGNDAKYYIGLTEGKFKERMHKHNTDFRHEKYRNSTTLSQHIWNLKDKGQNYSIKWSIIEKVPKYKPSDKFCVLCTTEKRHILFNENDKQLNKASEFISKCRHQNKFKLANIKGGEDVDLLAHTVKDIPTVDNDSINYVIRIPRKVAKAPNDPHIIKACTVRLKRIDTKLVDRKESTDATNEDHEKKFKEDAKFSQRGRKIKPSKKYGTEWVT